MSSASVAVVGGSIGGLCAGVALRAAGCEVEVYERREESLSSRGAGIVVQRELLQLVEGIGGASLPTTSCSHRRTVDADGVVSSTQPMPQRFTSWEAIHRALRTLYPPERYHLGMRVSGVSEAGERVRVELAGRGSSVHDLLILADGARSGLRADLGFDVTRTYAGYVAWRGTVAESELPERTVAFFDDAFVFCDGRDGGHALAYFIPGDGASVARGTRRLNWVWYESVPEGARLEEVLTDASGRRREGSIPPGETSASAGEALRTKAAATLEPHFAGLVDATRAPFLQSIEDQGSARMVHRRTALLGDAAFVIRPHTAAAAAKAAGDAMALADALRDAPDDIGAALLAYEARRLPIGLSLSGYGQALGRRTITPRGTRP